MFLVTRMFGLNDKKCVFILGARLYLDVVEHGNEFKVELVIKGRWTRSSRCFGGVGVITFLKVRSWWFMHMKQHRCCYAAYLFVADELIFLALRSS